MTSIPDNDFIKKRLNNYKLRKYEEIKNKAYKEYEEIEDKANKKYEEIEEKAYEEYKEKVYNYFIDNHPEIIFEWKMKKGGE